MPLISVVIPVYNVEAYIEEAIKSILSQTIQDFEILVIDDCSTDNTLLVVKNIKDDRIQIIEKPKNKGLVDSLNIGFKAAKGKFIARMDGDDISVVNRFEKQLHILQNNPDIKACGSWLQCFGASTKLINHKEHHLQIQAHLLLSNPMSLGATMLCRESYKDFKFVESKVHAEDYDLWAKTAWQYKLHNIQDVLYYYRIHDYQVSTLYNSIQKNQDVDIKLALYHKLDYDKVKFSDAFISNILFSNAPISLTDCIQFFNWLHLIVQINKKQQVFGHNEFLKVIEQLQRRFVFELFFTNHRKGMDYKLRKQIWRILPFKEKRFVFLKKIKERMSSFKKSIIKRKASL